MNYKNLVFDCNVGLRKLAWKVMQITIQHPFTYVKVLIQIGYEPYPPKLQSFLGHPYLALPNVFSYVDYIASVDGILGCFRGLIPNLCYIFVNLFVTRIMMRTYYYDSVFPPRKEKINWYKSQELEDQKIYNFIIHRQELEESKKVNFILKKAALKLICMTYGVYASHPFYVIMVRTMAQFVGRETKYTSIRTSVLEIYRNDGSAGYFKGIIARLFAEYLTVLIPTISILIASNVHIRSSWLVEQIANIIGSTLASRFVNRLYVVTNTRAVNNCGLLIGQHPHTIVYQNSLECWRVLSKLNQLNRGFYKCWRSYKGPTILVNGKLTPDGYIFGPLHR